MTIRAIGTLGDIPPTQEEIDAAWIKAGMKPPAPPPPPVAEEDAWPV